MFYRLFTLLETECHQLDLLLPTESDTAVVGAGPSFEDYVAMVRERQKLREQIDALELEGDELEGLITWYSLHLPNPELNPNLEVLRQQVQRITTEKQTSVLKQ